MSRSSRGRPTTTPFGERLRASSRAERPAGLVVLGSGAIPLARPTRSAALRRRGRAEDRRRLANNRYSADIVAIARRAADPRRTCRTCRPTTRCRAGSPRVAGYEVADLRRRWRLAVDIDGPLDLVLIGGRGGRPPVDLRPVRASDGGGPRTSPPTRPPSSSSPVAPRPTSVAWLERHGVADAGAHRGARAADAARAAASGRPPRSWERCSIATDPASLGELLARLGDAAIVDTGSCFAHRLGRGRAGLAGGGGPLRVGPAARRRDRGPVAARH